MADSDAVRQKRFRDNHPERHEAELERLRARRRDPAYREQERVRNSIRYHDPAQAPAVLRKLMLQQLRYRQRRLEREE